MRYEKRKWKECISGKDRMLRIVILGSKGQEYREEVSVGKFREREGKLGDIVVKVKWNRKDNLREDSFLEQRLFEFSLKVYGCM